MGNKILVTGGAGYVGSHVAKKLLKEGFSVVVIDNLSTGFIEPINILKKEYGHLEFTRGDLSDKTFLEKTFDDHKIDAVMHFAAKVSVSESVNNPELYHKENFINSVNLVEAMVKAGVNKFIFSSSCVVYGTPKYTPIDENHPIHPESPYGQTKLDFESYLARVKNLKYIIFRYFNVGGSDPEGLLGKSNIEREDLIANIVKVALGNKEYLPVFGRDYDTPDGTAIRDFLHVDDIAQAHLLALKQVDRLSGEVFNLGSETGFSVKKVVDKVVALTGKDIPIRNESRRPGDIVVSVASAKKVKEMLGWNPQYSDLETILKTDWNWRKTHPAGYTE